MDKYKLLYQQVIKIKEALELKQNELEKSVAINKKSVKEAEVEIKNLENEKSYNNYIYSTLVNYKSFITRKIKTHFIVGASMAGVLAVLLLIVGLIVSAPVTDILWALISAVVIGTTCGVSNFLDETKEERSIHKQYRKQTYGFPLMISSLEKRIEIEYDIKADFESKVAKLMDGELAELNNAINKCNEVLADLDSSIPAITYICRNDEETINEVFENDQQVQNNVAKLARKKKELVDTE